MNSNPKLLSQNQFHTRIQFNFIIILKISNTVWEKIFLYLCNLNLTDPLVVVPPSHSSVHGNGHHQANYQENPRGLVVGGDAFDSMEDVGFVEFA